MPEKPKRRKNNKNKRKNNKSNRTDNNNQNSSSSASADVSLNVDATPANLISDNNAEQIDDCLENVSNPTPIDTICLKIESETSNENAIKSNLVNDRADTILEKKVVLEESLETYVVETPDQNKKRVSKLTINSKSKSVDNDDSPTIVEITDSDNTDVTDATLTLIDSNNCIISDSESNVLWQKADDLVNFNVDPEGNPIAGALSITTIPLNIAECNQTKSLSPEEELTLRGYLKTLNLSTNPEYASTSEIKTEIEQVINREIKRRLRKSGLTEDNCMLRVGPSRSLALDVIDEEGSSESSVTSRRQSSLIDKKSDNEELEDDVFESRSEQISNSRLNNANKRNMNMHTIPQECIRVDAKLKEPEVTEARGSWTTKIVEKITGAELVYLTDSSSSTSSIYDINEDTENGEENDQLVRIITPTIEVTDTEKMLTELSKNKPDKSDFDSNLNISSEKDIHLDCNKTENITESIAHEIVVESTDDIKTNLIVKDIVQDHIANSVNEIALQRSPKAVDKYDLEIKVLKCELNDAINNLIKEVSSDSESTKDCSSDILSRQDSSSSVGSSQCTAKYNPTHSSLNDISGVINNNHDKDSEPSSHVKDVLEHLTQSQSKNNLSGGLNKAPLLRDLCLEKISMLPYGEKILEELAQVSTRLQHLSALSVINNTNFNTIKTGNRYKTEVKLNEKNESSVLESTYMPPPILPRKSSLKKEDKKPKVPPKPDHIHKCLSPSQKMLMEKTNTNVTKEPVKVIENIHKKNRDEKDNITSTSYIETSNNSPFKSQTGSRLLSLICDSSINNNISSSLMKSFSSKRLDQIPKVENTKTFSNYESKSEYFPLEKLSYIPKHKKISSSFYESDDSTGYTGHFYKNIQNERKHFHYSTGNLNSEIEDDISSIQNMHRYYTDIRNERKKDLLPRRPSLPRDLCDQQMEYIRQKEKEVDAEIRRLEGEKQSVGYKKGPKAPMISDNDNFVKQNISFQIHKTSKQSAKLPSLFSSSEEELLREKMYAEYVNKMAEREFRKEHKIIKITKPVSTTKSNSISHSLPVLDSIESKVNNRIEREFITKARERWEKLGIKESETKEVNTDCEIYSEPKVIEHKIKVIEAGKEKDVNNLPNHIQEFVKFTAKGKEQETEGMGECEPGNPPTHVVVLCAVIILMLTIGKHFLRLIRNTY